MWDSWSELLLWREDEMLARDDASLEVIKTILLAFSCFQNMHTIFHFKSLSSPC